MTDTDPIPAILDQLAAHHEQITRLSQTLQEHAAPLTELTSTMTGDAGPDGYHPERRPEWWKPPADARAQPIARLRAWVE